MASLAGGSYMYQRERRKEAAVRKRQNSLSRAQWQALFDLYLGVMIVVMRKSTMEVLERESLVARKFNHDRWRLTEAGKRMLQYAPHDLNPY